MKFPLRVFIAVLLLFFFACSPQENKWKNASQKNNIAAYEEYLKEYPSGSHVEDAKDSIANIVCGTAVKSKSIQMLNGFIAKYPGNKNVEKVNQLIEKLQWDTAFSLRSEKMLKDCISKYPKSSNVKKANDTISAIATELSKVKTIAICPYVGCTVYGCFTAKITETGGLEAAPCEPMLFFWRSFSKVQLPYMQKRGLHVGIAYLRTSKDQYRIEKEVDLNKSDKEICALFGIESTNAFNYTYYPPESFSTPAAAK